ncbi:hypothetical protein DFQ30_006788 [Apophysomyces sp. BC1015]|nr:hypothetical protein DFQ30_006788 [Apophysomyces sp. BC1015]KAG0176718.1 hypothetical protein DFQ29_005717 [Apophysomyces sp. BC1021]
MCDGDDRREKGLSICVPNSSKLVDGIGVSTFDNRERTLIEPSGVNDGNHAEEDTLKLVESMSLCLRDE